MATKLYRTQTPSNFTISTIKIDKIYETMVFDNLGEEVASWQTTRKYEAKRNHDLAVFKYI